MVIYVVGAGAFILGANVGVVLALLLLHGRAESLAEGYGMTGVSDSQEEQLVEESMTAVYL
jgi:hypothetical protein